MKVTGARYRRAIIALDGPHTRSRSSESRGFVRCRCVEDVDAFQTAALVAMRGAATPTDIAWFRDLHGWAASGIVGYNEEHALMKAILDEQIQRIHEIAGRLQARIK